MKIATLANRIGKVANDNSPLILTAVGVAGTITTAVLAGKASVKAYQIIESNSWVSEPTNRERLAWNVKNTWHCFVPPVAVGALTITSIVFANRIGTRRAAAMAAAYSLSERAFDEYREKIVEKLGVKKELEARDEIAQDRVNANPVSGQQVIVSGGNVLCYDHYTGRYFESDMESLKKAQNDLNYKLINEYYASLNDFYDKLGLPRVTHGDEVGWNSDELLDLKFSTTMSDDQRPCIAIDFNVSPVRNYFRHN